MMKHEFESLALRGNAAIGVEMYAAIERFYTSENDYHRNHGGINETKRDFVKRVFGGKVNTPKMICEKIAAESCRENRYLLQGCPSANKSELDRMDAAIINHYRALLKYGW